MDDDPSCLQYLTRLFQQDGHAVRPVGTGMEALLEASGAKWDLIILDRVLPDISAVEVQRRIRAREDETPVMLVTAYPDSDALAEAVHLGLSDYAVKPFIGSRLLEAVVRAAERRFPTTNQPTNQPPRRDVDLRHVLSALDALSSAADGSPMQATRIESSRRLLLCTTVDEAVSIPAFVVCAEGYRDLGVAAPDIVERLAGDVTRRLRLAPGATRHLGQRSRAVVDLFRSADRGIARLTERSIARQLGTRAETISREIHAESGLTFRQWRWGAILRIAAQQLAGGIFQVKEVAGHLGYAHADQLKVDWRRLFGFPPSLARARFADPNSDRKHRSSPHRQEQAAPDEDR